MEPCNAYHCLRRSDLTLAWLEKFPVWGSFEDDDSEMIRPVLGEPFAADCDPLITKARIITNEDIELSGCVYLDRAFDRVYLINVYLRGMWFGFHRQLQDLAAADAERLRVALGNSEAKIFPVRFETQMHDQGKDFEGEFTPFGEGR
jgi:hypothetical protein